MATIPETLTIAIHHHQGGQLQAAEQLYRQILQVEPNHPDALHFLGLIAYQMGRLEIAVETIGRALQQKPDYTEAHCNLGVVLKDQGKLEEAVACFRRALHWKPDYAEGHYNLGVGLKDQGKLDEAADCYRRALQLKPDYAVAHNNLGVVLKDQGKLYAAADSYRRALDLKPDYAVAHNNLGVVLKDQGKLDEAIACFRRALQLKPDYAEGLSNLGNALSDQGKLDEAVVCYRRALQLKPDLAEGHSNLGSALSFQGNMDEAAQCYRRALQLKPDKEVWLGSLVYALQHLCSWDNLASYSQRVIEVVDRDGDGGINASVSPFSFLALPTPTTAKQQLRCARRWAEQRLMSAMDMDGPMDVARPFPTRSKIRIGYLSADFQTHPVAQTIAELFEKHDRSRFEIIGYSYGPDDASPMRQRLVQAFDQFVDLKAHSNRDAARRIQTDGVDILIDLMGYTKGNRMQILALRPAPVQVHYLGYPGTLGAPFIDYLIVDDFIVPPEQQPFFSECLVHLPGCFMVSDGQRAIDPRTPTRAECGLPEDGFVFCSFNSNYKITPAVFDVWMRLLQAVPGSVLWLQESNRFAAANLRREAARAVQPERLVFSRRLPSFAQHLARYRLADLFLDTFPYNAHTTANDSLWAGCPVLTLAGETFVSRVAGSMLRTLDLPDLITTTLKEYETLALRLARNLADLAALRARLSRNREASSLFDTAHFARGLEAAFERMWKFHGAGSKPQSFAVSTP